MNKTLVIASVALVIGLCGLFFPQVTERITETVSLGAAGQNNSFTQYFDAGFVTGGQLTIATTTSIVLKAREMDNASVISFSAGNSPVINVTLPASSTFPLGKAGETRTWIIDNLHTAAATTTTIVAGTGVDIDGDTANDDVINGGVSGKLTCWRLPNTDIRCYVNEGVDAG